jgi:hypothetical protein
MCSCSNENVLSFGEARSREQIAGPVLVTGGGKDGIWPSGLFMRMIVERARAYGRTDIVGHIYPKAERISFPASSTEHAPHWARPQPKRGPIRWSSLRKT